MSNEITMPFNEGQQTFVLTQEQMKAFFNLFVKLEQRLRSIEDEVININSLKPIITQKEAHELLSIGRTKFIELEQAGVIPFVTLKNPYGKEIKRYRSRDLVRLYERPPVILK